MSQLKDLSAMAQPDDPAVREALDLWEKLQPNSPTEFFDAVREMARQEEYEKARQEGYEKGFQEGFEEGIEKGRKQVRLKIAARLLRMGKAVSDVREATQLSLVEIGNLQDGGIPQFDS